MKNDKHDGEPPAETYQINNLVKKFSGEEAEKVLAGIPDDLQFFFKREHPIQSMRERKQENISEGNENQGKIWQKQLGENTPLKRLKGMVRTLYLIRSNLFHGSKSDSGDDELVIQHSVGALKVLLEATIQLTRKKCPFQL